MFSLWPSCPTPKGQGHQVTASSRTGLQTRSGLQMFDVESYFNDMASEYLKCSKCRRQFIWWSDVILGQLDIDQRRLFPAILTYRSVFVLKCSEWPDIL